MDEKSLREKMTVLWKSHRGLSWTLIVFSIIHLFLWANYYASYYGWVRQMNFFNPLFFLAGVLYGFIYLCVFIISYSYGKKFFLLVVSIFLFSIFFTLPFSLAKVDLGVKFALLLKNDFEWNYIQNYISWIIISIGIGLPVWWFVLKILSKTYKTGLRVKKRFQRVIWGCFILLMGWHTVIGNAIDEESLPLLHYDNEVGRILRVFTALGTKNFEVFEYKNLPGNFILHEQTTQSSKGVHGVLALLDTLEYEFLSVHGNQGTPLNQELQKQLQQGHLVDLGLVYSCGSHTTASIPNILSMNGCRVGPKFHSEPIMHLMKRIGVENHYIGAEGLSQYFATAFSLEAPEKNRHYIEYKETPIALKIAAEDLQSYPDVPSSFTMVYYDAVHPGIRCEFLTGGGLPATACYEGRNFSGDIYQEGMNRAVQVIENDIVNFMRYAENSDKPIFMLLTSDHGLSPHFLHGDMADSDVSLDKRQEATQRHSTLLFYGNKVYRNLKAEQWGILQKNAKQYSGRLNHEVVFPSFLEAMGIQWEQGSDILSQNSIFSRSFKPKNKKPILANAYLGKKA